MKNMEFKDKLAKRLAYLWHIRDTETKRYMDNHMGYEKEDIYTMYGSDDLVGRMANDYYRRTYGAKFEAFLKEAEGYRYDIETDVIQEGE